jgi:hypothetical protein
MDAHRFLEYSRKVLQFRQLIETRVAQPILESDAQLFGKDSELAWVG